jgi:hypothetical protein
VFFEDLKRFCKVEDTTKGSKPFEPAPAKEDPGPEKENRSASSQLSPSPKERVDRESGRGECKTFQPPQLRLAEESRKAEHTRRRNPGKKEGSRRTPFRPGAMTRKEIRPEVAPRRKVMNESESSNANPTEGQPSQGRKGLVSETRSQSKGRCFGMDLSPGLIDGGNTVEEPFVSAR